MNHFFNNNEIVFYNNINDLSDKINFYSKNDKLRKKLQKMDKKNILNYLTKNVLQNIFISTEIFLMDIR